MASLGDFDIHRTAVIHCEVDALRSGKVDSSPRRDGDRTEETLRLRDHDKIGRRCQSDDHGDRGPQSTCDHGPIAM